MSEDTQQVETQEAEAPLVNVLKNDQEEVQADAPIPVHDDSEPQDVADDDKELDDYSAKDWEELITTQRNFGMKMGQMLKSLQRVMRNWKKLLDPANIKHRKAITMLRIWLIVASIWKIRLLGHIKSGLKNMAFHKKRLKNWLVKFLK